MECVDLSAQCRMCTREFALKSVFLAGGRGRMQLSKAHGTAVHIRFTASIRLTIPTALLCSDFAPSSFASVLRFSHAPWHVQAVACNPAYLYSSNRESHSPK